MIINSGQQAAQITRDPVFIHYIWTFLFTQILTGNVTFYFFPLTFSQWAAFHLKQWEDPSCYREPKPKHTIEKKPDKATGNVPATHTEVFFITALEIIKNSFRSTLTGIPCNCGLSSKLWSSFLDASTFSWSAASTIYLKWAITISNNVHACAGNGINFKFHVHKNAYTIALTPRQ